jgi:hypothetical protein
MICCRGAAFAAQQKAPQTMRIFPERQRMNYSGAALPASYALGASYFLAVSGLMQRIALG